MNALFSLRTAPAAERGAAHTTEPVRRRPRLLQPSGLLWLVPAMAASCVLIYSSLGYTIHISTLEWDGISSNPAPAGVGNYLRAFGDPIFWGALWHTAVFLVGSFAGQAFFGFLVAVILHSGVRAGGLYKVIIFLPVIIAPATMAPVFRQIFANEGQFNAALDGLGLGFLTQPWLAQSGTALFVIICVAIWQYSGLAFVLYYAAIGQIDGEMIEAGRLDGAGNARVVCNLVWPQVRGTTITLALLATINSLKLFDFPELLTHGGPNYSTEFLGTYIYRVSIPLFDVGYGAALSIILLVLAVGPAVLFSRHRRRANGRTA